MKHSPITNTTRITAVDFIKGRKGEFRAVVKVQAGFMTVVECRKEENEFYSTRPAQILADYKKGALQTVEFRAEGSDNFLTVFARKGTTIVLADEDILATLDVGTINQLWSNTNLYDQNQYAAVGARTWADLAFVKKEDQPATHTIQA